MNTDTTAGRRTPRLRTLVFGLLLALVSVSACVSEAAGDRVDGAALVIAALIGSGVILLVGAVGAATRGEHQDGAPQGRPQQPQSEPQQPPQPQQPPEPQQPPDPPADAEA